MPVPKNRANSVRNIKYRSPSGESRLRYRRRTKGGKHYCAVSGDLLTGTHSISKMRASERRPERPFGGRLSPAISRRVIVYRARIAQGLIGLDDVPIKLLNYVKNAAKK